MYTIHPLTALDVEEYKALRLHALKNDSTAFFSTYDEYVHLPVSSYLYEIEKEKKPFGYLGAFDDGKLLGYGTIQRPYSVKQQHTAELMNLYVVKDARGNGIGSALVSQLIENVRSTSSIESVFLTVVATNTHAILLYRKFGFVEYAKKVRSLLWNDVYTDEIFMRLDF